MFAKILSAISFLVLIYFLAGQVQGTHDAKTDWIIEASAAALVVGGYGIARPGKFTGWVKAVIGWANGNKPGVYLFSIIAAIAVVAAWYMVDGRYTYQQDGRLVYRVDRLTGQSATCSSYGCR